MICRKKRAAITLITSPGHCNLVAHDSRDRSDMHKVTLFIRAFYGPSVRRCSLPSTFYYLNIFIYSSVMMGGRFGARKFLDISPGAQ